jgi:hypothetical protein
MTLLNWIDFDTRPLFWWLFGHLFLGIFSCWLIFRNRPVSNWLFLSILVFITGLMRFPVFLYNLPLNPDESQMLAQGLTLTVDPLLYRSVDPTTSGPINTYLLSIVHLLGFRLDFQVAHILSWLISLTSIYFLYKALKSLLTTYISQLALIPTVVFFSFAQNANYVHYYSEGIAIALLSFCTYQLAHWTATKKFTYVELIRFGISNGLIVLCKIQALPLAFVVGIWSLVLIYSFQKSQWLRYGSILAGSVLTVWAGWLFYMQINGLLNDFFLYYIIANAQLKVQFSESHSPSYQFIYHLIHFPMIVRAEGAELNYWFYSFVGLGGVFLVQHFSKAAFIKIVKLDHYFWAMVSGYFLMVVAVIIRTGSFYTHHFLFFVLPGGLLTGLFLSQLRFSSPWKWVILLTQLFFLLKGIRRSTLNIYETAYSQQNKISPVGKAILNYGKPGEYLAVWGWSCEYYVETQMPQGVNENHSVRSAMKHPLQEVYYQRYLRDLKRTKPTVFVDAMTTQTLWMNDPKKYGHQNYPELARYISDHYQLKEEINGVRIYAAK